MMINTSLCRYFW